jgi:hypothetical protein
MNIKFLDICFRINGDVHQDRIEILLYDCQKQLAKEIPMIDDLRDLEMYEIMRMPVISLTFNNEQLVTDNIDMRLKILCFSYVPGCSPIYLFSGENWTYYVKFY